MTLARHLALAVALLAAPVHAAQSSDQDWPCVQRKVEHLSVAVMWPEPIPEATEPLPEDFEQVAEQMALRRVSLEDVERLVDKLKADHPDMDPGLYGRLFADAFERIDRQRSRIVSGITRYAKGQADLASEIDALQVEMRQQQAAEEPNFDRMDEIEAELDWRERVFDDRDSALTYVCESPVLLEKRAYEIAQILRARLD